MGVDDGGFGRIPPGLSALPQDHFLQKGDQSEPYPFSHPALLSLEFEVIFLEDSFSREM